MSAVYTPKAFQALVDAQVNAVMTYFTGHPGATIEAAATALAQPYEVVYQAIIQLGLVVLPNAAGELHWNQRHP